MAKILLGFVLFVVGVQAAADPVPSQKLFDPLTWSQNHKSLTTKEVIILQKWITIHYDYFIQRPWEPEEFKKEYKNRFAAFKGVFCPYVANICAVAVPKKIWPDILVQETAEALAQPATIQQINDRLVQLGSRVKMSLPVTVPGILPPDSATLNKYNFLLGEFVLDKKNGVTRVKRLIQADVGSYYTGFQQENSPNFFAIDNAKNIYILDETLIGEALPLAAEILATEGAKIDVTTFEITRLLLRRFYKDLSPVVASYSQKLKKNEALEWAVYEELDRTLVKQAQYFKQGLATSEYNVDLRSVLLKLQKTANPNLFFYEIFNFSLFESNHLLKQYLSKSLANLILLENTNLFLGEDPYTSSLPFESLNKNLNIEFVLNPNVLQNSHPELHKTLTEKNLYQEAAWKKLNTNEKRQILKTFLYPELPVADKENPTTKVIPTKAGLYSLSGAIVLGLDAATLQAFADKVLKTRFPQAKTNL